MPRNNSTNLAIARLAQIESTLIGSEFLAPVARGGGVAMKLAGVRCALRIDEPREFTGWGVFRATSYTSATLVRDATARESRQYLRLFPPTRLVVCGRRGGVVEALPANADGDRMQINGWVDVQLPIDVDLFDTIISRFDGGVFWFDHVDPRTDPAAAAYLRQRWIAMTPPEFLDRPALTAGQRAAYAHAYDRRQAAIRAAEAQQGELRLTRALTHGGATLHDFAEARDSYRVTYTVDGRRHVSVVDKQNLTVQSAGICLSGEDRKFDLESLVGVLREGTSRRWPRALTLVPSPFKGEG
jgi:hypothetical protein